MPTAICHYHPQLVINKPKTPYPPYLIQQRLFQIITNESSSDRYPPFSSIQHNQLICVSLNPNSKKCHIIQNSIVTWYSMWYSARLLLTKVSKLLSKSNVVPRAVSCKKPTIKHGADDFQTSYKKLPPQNSHSKKQCISHNTTTIAHLKADTSSSQTLSILY